MQIGLLNRRALLARAAGSLGAIAAAPLLTKVPLLTAPSMVRAQETPSPDVGPGASLNGRVPFSGDDPWNRPVADLPVDPNSSVLIARIGMDTGLHPDFGTVWNGAPNGIPYVVVSGDQPRVPITFTAYGDESDPGPYPVPPDAPVEGGPNADGDRHVLVVDRDAWQLYELFDAHPDGAGGWQAGSGAVFDLTTDAARPAGWTSADAAGLPIFPGLVRYDEAVELGQIAHALRFTVQRTRRAYLPPARHWASSARDATLAPMGMRVRLRPDFDTSAFPPVVQAILTALKTYGMFVADNGSNWFISGAPDPRWSDEDLSTIRRVHGRDFQVVQMQGLVTA